MESATRIKTAKLGGTTVADLSNPKKNCAKLGRSSRLVDDEPWKRRSCPQNAQTLDFLPNRDTAHLHMTPVQFHDPVMNSWTIFAWGENSQLHKWAVSPAGALTFVRQGTNSPARMSGELPPGGMPGGFCSGSSNGADPNSAILVCTILTGMRMLRCRMGDCWSTILCTRRSTDPWKVLWDSQRFNIQISVNKFDPPGDRWRPDLRPEL